MPGRHNQISGYTGFQPRYPLAEEPNSAKWVSLQLDREAMLLRLFASIDLNSDGVLSLDEMKRLAEGALIDPEHPGIKAAFAKADFSGLDGMGGDGTLTVHEVIHSTLESTASFSDEQFEAYCAQWIAVAKEVLAK